MKRSGILWIALLVFGAVGNWSLPDARSHAATTPDAAGTAVMLQTVNAALEATISALHTQVSEQSTTIAKYEPTATETLPTKTALHGELAPGLELIDYRFVESGLYHHEGSDKATFLLGEIRNTTDKALDAPGLRFVLLDNDGNIIGRIDGNPILPVILPGQTMPFQSAVYGDEPHIGEWSSEEIEICGTWGSTDALERFDPRGLEARDVTEIERSSERLVLRGFVHNKTNAPAEGVYIKVAIYDREGRFSGWDWTALDVAIPPGKSARFTVGDALTPLDAIGLAGEGYRYQLWVGFDSPFGAC